MGASGWESGRKDLVERGEGFECGKGSRREKSLEVLRNIPIMGGKGGMGMVDEERVGFGYF